ncbi:MAG: hypothetical protein R8G66_05450 [Cytophagales bacterium]|nr:hypothetical protein [Cytophagales bacterium]
MFKTISKALLLSILLIACKSRQVATHDNICTLNFKLTQESAVLIDRPWTETNITIMNWDENGDSNDVTDQFMSSDLDDVIIFKKDGTFAFDEGASKAQPESAQVYESGNWSLYHEEKKLIFCTDGHNTIYKVVEVAPELLVLQLQKSKSGKKYTYTLTYSSK